jgi:hypothetical protein
VDTAKEIVVATAEKATARMVAEMDATAENKHTE